MDAVDKTPQPYKVTTTRGRITETLQADNAPADGSYFVLTPQIFSDKETLDTPVPEYNMDDDIAYADEPIVVWVVDPATSNPRASTSTASALLDDDRRIKDCAFGQNAKVTTLDAVEVFPREDKFRTCFTLWSYRQDDTFLRDTDKLTVAEFEAELEKIPAANKIEIVTYSTRPSGRRIFKIHS